MYKSRLDLFPWDCCQPRAAALSTLVAAAQFWWVRETDALPCCVPASLLHGVGRVLDMGARKYSERGWETDQRYHSASGHFGALIRHATSLDIDAESGMPHEWHAATRYVMLSTLLARGVLLDDRPARQQRPAQVLTKGGEA